jgi:hypothetical protein
MPRSEAWVADPSTDPIAPAWLSGMLGRTPPAVNQQMDRSTCRLTAAMCRHSVPLSRAGVVGARSVCECALCCQLLGARCLSLEDYVTGKGVTRVMDYDVLLLSRIQEEYRRWPDNARAVSAGLGVGCVSGSPPR